MSNPGNRNLIYPRWPTRAARKLRAKIVSDVFIRASLVLDNSKKSTFSGRARLRLRLRPGKGSSLKINYSGKPIRVFSVSENGKLVRLKFKREELGFTVQLAAASTIQKVEILIDFESRFDDGGLSRFVDHADGSVYYRTNANPFHLSRIIPCLDQPEILCAFQIDVTTHKENVCRFSSMLRRRQSAGSFQIFHFQPSVPFKTAQFVLIAGPYVIFKEIASVRKSRRPYLLYALRSQLRIPQWGDIGFIVTDPRDS